MSNKTKKVLVTNIPVRIYVEAYVEVPKDTRPEDLNEAVRKSLIETGVSCKRGQQYIGYSEEPVELDEDAIQVWEFDVKYKE
jgi:hypothetical protein